MNRVCLVPMSDVEVVVSDVVFLLTKYVQLFSSRVGADLQIPADYHALLQKTFD